jgi:hypothetical protein
MNEHAAAVHYRPAPAFALAYAGVASPLESGDQHKVNQRGIVKILLIEDTKFQRIANERALVKAGYGVIHAGDGRSRERS